MAFKIRSVTFVILSTAGIIFAQNARLSSLAGCNTVDDIARILNFPAEMNDYSNNIQASASGESYYGPIIGFKSFGNVFNIGGTWTRDQVMSGSFYSRAESFLDTTINIDVSTSTMHQIPHLLFGWNFDGFQLGFDVFLEYASTFNKSETEIDNSTYTDRESGNIFNVGFQVNPKFSIGKGGAISPVIGVGFPRMSGYIEADTSRAVLAESRTENTSFFGIAGIEVVIPFSRVDWRIGLAYKLEKYKFEMITPVSIDSPEYFDNYFTLYTGFAATLIGDILFVSQYDASLALEKTTSKNTLSNITTTTRGMPLSQNIRIGIERPTYDLFIFDAFIPRAGIRFNIQRAWDISESESPVSTTTTIVRRIDRQVTAWPTIGLGVQRGIASLDVYLQLGNWSGVVGGPSVLMGTFTLDFGKMRDKSNNGIRSVEQPRPGKKVEETPKVETESKPVERPTEPVLPEDEIPTEPVEENLDNQ